MDNPFLRCWRLPCFGPGLTTFFPPSAAKSEMRKNEFMPQASPEGIESETKL